MKYANLRAEMARKGVKTKQIATLIDVHQNAVYRKMNGKSPFFFEEAKAIKNNFFPEKELEDLFADEWSGETEQAHAGA